VADAFETLIPERWDAPSWCRGRRVRDVLGGAGPEVTGRAIDLVMLMANRQQVIATLSGPGVRELTA
jgi:hypothetical protein